MKILFYKCFLKFILPQMVTNSKATQMKLKISQLSTLKGTTKVPTVDFLRLDTLIRGTKFAFVTRKKV